MVSAGRCDTHSSVGSIIPKITNGSVGKHVTAIFTMFFLFFFKA